MIVVFYSSPTRKGFAVKTYEHVEVTTFVKNKKGTMFFYRKGKDGKGEREFICSDLPSLLIASENEQKKLVSSLLSEI